MEIKLDRILTDVTVQVKTNHLQFKFLKNLNTKKPVLNMTITKFREFKQFYLEGHIYMYLYENSCIFYIICRGML